jgi:hypothetical protein
MRGESFCDEFYFVEDSRNIKRKMLFPSLAAALPLVVAALFIIHPARVRG